MRYFVAALFMGIVCIGDVSGQESQRPDIQAGKVLWQSGAECRNCHGVAGEGGFGPALAGQTLTAEAYKKALRNPSGIMPKFAVADFGDTDIADLVAYMATLPARPPGKWRYEIPDDAAPGLAVALTAGCAQCHGVRLSGPRGSIAAAGGDWAYFKALVYDHHAAMARHTALIGTKLPPRLNMGSYDPERLPESDLRIIYDWMDKDLGLRALVHGRLSRGDDMTYQLALDNTGIPGKGHSAEDITVRLVIPADAQVAAATGEGYQGVQWDAEAKAEIATWKLARMDVGYRRMFTVTLSRGAFTKDNVRGQIRWTKPDLKVHPYEEAEIYPGAL